MYDNIQSICNKEIKRLGKNVRLILNKNNISNEDLADLNDLYNSLDFYEYHKNYQRFKNILAEELEDY